MRDHFDVVIVGAGAAGLAAARRLEAAGVNAVVLEARDRIGGRGHTLAHPAAPVDMGCSWLHSADHNVWRALAPELGFHVEACKAPWERKSESLTPEEHASFGEAFAAFEKRIDEEAETNPPVAAAAYLREGCRWNGLLDTIFSYINGAALDHTDARDYARYEDTGVNWRVREGYGAMIAAYGAAAPVRLGVEVREIQHDGLTPRVVTNQGALTARVVILAVPTTILMRLGFTPDLPRIREAAEVLPLGAAEKVFLELTEPEETPHEMHMYGRIDGAPTGSYHFRPLGRPVIEVYLGGPLSHELGLAGPAALTDFALQELSALMGSTFPARVKPIVATHWAGDPWALGSYSYAKPGCADARAVLAAGVEGRIFIAGEAASRNRFSTAHGAFETGVAAAEQALAALAAAPRPG